MKSANYIPFYRIILWYWLILHIYICIIVYNSVYIYIHIHAHIITPFTIRQFLTLRKISKIAFASALASGAAFAEAAVGLLQLVAAVACGTAEGVPTIGDLFHITSKKYTCWRWYHELYPPKKWGDVKKNGHLPRPVFFFVGGSLLYDSWVTPKPP